MLNRVKNKITSFLEQDRLKEQLAELSKECLDLQSTMFRSQTAINMAYTKGIKLLTPIDIGNGRLLSSIGDLKFTEQITELSRLLSFVLEQKLKALSEQVQENANAAEDLKLLESQLSQAYLRISVLEESVKNTEAQYQAQANRSLQLEDMIKRQNETVKKAHAEWQAQYSAVSSKLHDCEEKLITEVASWLKTGPKSSVYGYESIYEREMSLKEAATALERGKWRK